MAYSGVNRIVWDLAEPIAKELGAYLYDVEYLKEGGNRILRILADKEEGGISLDDCEAISRRISDALDKADPIPQNYYLEVSSPGVERKLKTADHFRRYMGEMIDVGLYRSRNGSKQMCGLLSGYDGESLTVTVDGEEITIPLSDASVVHLHFDF